MAFPDIKLNEPTGEEYVSQIDNFERETRSWLKDIVNIITGYPLVETLAVKVWGTQDSPRPTAQTVNSINKTILGFNASTNELEVLQPDTEHETMNVLSISKQILNTIYPVGSYYETSDGDFDPNTAWGGTWVKDTPGRVMVSQGRPVDGSNNKIAGTSHVFAAGEIGGEESHNLIRTELPIHYHPHKHPHAHDIKETITNNNTSEDVAKKYVVTTQGTPSGYIPSVAASAGTNPINIKLVDETGLVVEHAPSSSQHGMIDWDNVDENTLMHVGTAWQRTDENNYTSVNEHNNLQPYKVCYRWHRTA